MAASVKKTAIQMQMASELAAPEGVGGGCVDQIAPSTGEDLSQMLLALHLDMVQMHEAQSAEIRGLRDEVKQLKEELSFIRQSAKPSGEVWGI